MTLDITMLRERAAEVAEALQAEGFEVKTKSVGKKHAELSIQTEHAKLPRIGEIIDSI